MNNLSSYCGLTDARMTASEKDLPVIHIQILHVFFQLNYYYWPWDTQSCELIVGSWTKSGWEVDVVNMNGGKFLFT